MRLFRFGSLKFLRHRLSLVALGTMLAMLLVGPASAHISVNPGELPVNSFETLTVSVPNEKEVPTVKVRIEFPDTLIVSRFQPKPGWQRELEKNAQGRISAATWSGGTIGANEYEEFMFLARTPREPGRLVFKAYQTYEDGETVAWDGEEVSDYPAPFIEVTNTTPSEQGGSVGSVEQPSAAPSTADPLSPNATITVGSATEQVTATTVATAPALPVTATAIAPPSATSVVNGASAAATQTPLSAIGPTSTVANTTASGSDLSLFAALGALGVSITALVFAGVALFRRSGTT